MLETVINNWNSSEVLEYSMRILYSDTELPLRGCRPPVTQLCNARCPQSNYCVPTKSYKVAKLNTMY